MDKIKEARERGYREGVYICYESTFYPDTLDRLEGDYFEMKGKDVVAYKKHKNERLKFEDWRFDRIYDGDTDKWVKIVKNNDLSNFKKDSIT